MGTLPVTAGCMERTSPLPSVSEHEIVLFPAENRSTAEEPVLVSADYELAGREIGLLFTT